MSETAFDARSPGEMLRLAREKQGMHIAALAAAIKVSPRKIDALEHDRWDELPDATFTRALAQTVCRYLKIDTVPVLALLPRSGSVPLEPAGLGLNAPFKGRPGRDDAALPVAAARPLVIAAIVLMLAAVAVYALPEQMWEPGGWFSGAASAASAAVPAAPASSLVGVGPGFEAAVPPLVEPAASVPATVPAASAAGTQATSTPGLVVSFPAVPVTGSSPTVSTNPTPSPLSVAMQPAGPSIEAAVAAPKAPPPGASALRVRATARSWVEARDGAGRTLVSRLVQPGESLDLDGTPPLRLTVGNAAATEVSWRGATLDLSGTTRDNVARIELK